MDFHGQFRFTKWKFSQLPWSNSDQSTSQPVKAQMKSRTFLVGPEAGGVAGSGINGDFSQVTLYGEQQNSWDVNGWSSPQKYL